MAAPKRLTRGDDRILGGVVSGFAEYLHMDVALLRIGVAILTFVTGLIPMILIYLISWAVMPER